MKKLVAFAAIVAAVSFTSCGNKSAESNAEVAETETTVEETPAVVEEETVTEEVAPAEGDSTAVATETEAAPAEYYSVNS